MALESEKYDTGPAVDRLIEHAMWYLGPVAWRLVGPEITEFIRLAVEDELRGAFQKAEFIYVNQAVAHSQEMGGLLLKAAIAGVDIANRPKEDPNDG
jgi:hypothetical protein